MYYLVVILFAVGWILLSIVRNYIATKSPISHKYLNHGTKISVPALKCSNQVMSKYSIHSFYLYFNKFYLANSGFLNLRAYSTNGIGASPSNSKSNNNYNNDELIPVVVVYEDAFEMKKIILKNNKEKTGIYMLTNKLTGDIYVGQSVDLRKRFINYFSLSYITRRDDLVISPQRSLAPWAALRTGALIKYTFYINHFQNAPLNSPKWYSTNTKYSLSSVVSHHPINPWFITGFTDGEGCFTLNFYKSTETKLGWKVQAIFSIGLDKRDEAILHDIKATWGVGGIYHHRKNNSVQIVIKSLNALKVIFDHFDKYPLITQKRADYLLFKKGVDLINNKEHLTIEGLRKFIAIRASMNKGLSDKLKASFPDIVPVPRPLVEDCTIPHPFWLAGFATAEGCFLINMIRSSAYRVGFQVRLVFTISQHTRDKQLMTSLTKYWDCGYIYDNRGAVDLVISRFKDLDNKILPFFKKYPILGVKSRDYLDFLNIIEIMRNKAHITMAGIEEIRNIKAGMNKNRLFTEGVSLLEEEVFDINYGATRKASLRIKETKIKMSTASPSVNSVNVYEKCDSSGFKLIGSFVSPRRAGKFLDISGSTVINYMKSGAIFKDRYKFSSR